MRERLNKKGNYMFCSEQQVPTTPPEPPQAEPPKDLPLTTLPDNGDDEFGQPAPKPELAADNGQAKPDAAASVSNSDKNKPTPEAAPQLVNVDQSVDQLLKIDESQFLTPEGREKETKKALIRRLVELGAVPNTAAGVKATQEGFDLTHLQGLVDSANKNVVDNQPKQTVEQQYAQAEADMKANDTRTPEERKEFWLGSEDGNKTGLIFDVLKNDLRLKNPDLSDENLNALTQKQQAELMHLPVDEALQVFIDMLDDTKKDNQPKDPEKARSLKQKLKDGAKISMGIARDSVDDVVEEAFNNDFGTILDLFLAADAHGSYGERLKTERRESGKESFGISDFQELAKTVGESSPKDGVDKNWRGYDLLMSAIGKEISKQMNRQPDNMFDVEASTQLEMQKKAKVFYELMVLAMNQGIMLDACFAKAVTEDPINQSWPGNKSVSEELITDFRLMNNDSHLVRKLGKPPGTTN
jgi:hypothetical protein